MKTVKDIYKIVNHHCYEMNGAECDRLWCVCCAMCTIAEKMILGGEY